jgi:hypothetical protein
MILEHPNSTLHLDNDLLPVLLLTLAVSVLAGLYIVYVSDRGQIVTQRPTNIEPAISTPTTTIDIPTTNTDIDTTDEPEIPEFDPGALTRFIDRLTDAELFDILSFLPLPWGQTEFAVLLKLFKMFVIFCGGRVPLYYAGDVILIEKAHDNLFIWHIYRFITGITGGDEYAPGMKLMIRRYIFDTLPLEYSIGRYADYKRIVDNVFYHAFGTNHFKRKFMEFFQEFCDDIPSMIYYKKK